RGSCMTAFSPIVSPLAKEKTFSGDPPGFSGITCGTNMNSSSAPSRTIAHIIIVCRSNCNLQIVMKRVDRSFHVVARYAEGTMGTHAPYLDLIKSAGRKRDSFWNDDGRIARNGGRNFDRRLGDKNIEVQIGIDHQHCLDGVLMVQGDILCIAEPGDYVFRLG